MKSVLSNLKQLLLIVFSVVLGIFLSDRLEEWKNEKEASLLLFKLKQEVNDNRALLLDWTPYHRGIIVQLDSLTEDEAFVNAFIADKYGALGSVMTRGNLMGQTPTKEAWDIAKSHPLMVHIDYEKLFLLSKIYSQQAMTYDAVPNIINLLLSPEFNAPDKAKVNLQSFASQLREVTTREIQLLQYIQEAESTLELEHFQ